MESGFWIGEYGITGNRVWFYVAGNRGEKISWHTNPTCVILMLWDIFLKLNLTNVIIGNKMKGG